MRRILLLTVLMAWVPLAASEGPLNLDQYRGKVIVLDFWASWCVPCRRSFPWMNEMHARYEDDGLVIIAVNLDRESTDATAFLAKYPANFEIVYDPTADLARKYQVEVMPSSLVIGRDGEIIARHTGFKVRQQDDYEAILQSALGKE